jgi:hypothetical protein
MIKAAKTQPKIGQSKATTVDQGMGCQVNIVFA